jgi:hypothetical protein
VLVICIVFLIVAKCTVQNLICQGFCENNLNKIKFYENGLFKAFFLTYASGNFW